MATIKQNVSIAQLLEWSQTNPNRSNTLTPIELLSESSLLRSTDSTMKMENTLDTIRLPKFESITLNPSGMLSAIAFMTDTVYPYAPIRTRNMTLRELATRLQQDTDSLTGTALGRKRRKIHDGIGSLANGATIKPEEWIDLFSSLAIMRNLQLIFIQMSTIEHDSDSEITKSIYFSSDPSTWTASKKVWVVDYYGRWIASPTTEISLQTLCEWIEDIEIYGWIVHWHIDASVTKEELVKILSLQPAWQKEHTKLKKDTLAIRLAKYKTTQAFYKISHIVT